MVQEVYDSQVLHRMLGVTPTASLTGKVVDNVNVTSRTAEAKSVETAWGEADMFFDTHNGSEEEEEIESRYDIESRRPPAKRRRTGTQADVHTVYTTDEDEDTFSISHQRGDEDGISEEEGEYDLSVSDAERPGRAEAASRRSYWLSKAMASAHDSGDE